ELGGAEELGIDPAFGPDDFEPGDGGGFLDRVEAVAGTADHEQGDVGALTYLFDGDDRVDPAAERDQGARPGGGWRPGTGRRLGGSWGRGGCLGWRSGGLDSGRGQVEGVVVGELAQAVEVEVTEEGFLGFGQGGGAEVDHGGRGGLVVGDAGQEEHQPGGGLGRLG